MQLVGRHREQAEVNRFLDVLLEGPAALVLEGEAGIGKTTVWRAALDAARSRSCRVLVCRASESEGALSFLGLCDLLEGAGDDPSTFFPSRSGQRSSWRSGDRRGSRPTVSAWRAAR